jgi:hemolysin activation/secretion protein
MNSRVIVVLLAALWPAADAVAQTPPGSTAPGQLREQFEAPPEPRATPPAAEPGVPEQQVPAGAEDVTFVLQQVAIDGVTVYQADDLATAWADLVGQQVSFADIIGLANALTARYRADGYILSQVVVPAQQIEDGVVRLRAVEGFVDEIRFDGEIQGPQAILDAFAEQVRAERPLTAAALERHLLLIGDLPGVNVQSVLEPSPTEFGAADLTIVVSHLDVEGFLSLDNYASEFVGPFTLSGGVSTYSALGLYEQIDLFAAFNPEDPEEMRFGQVRLTLPVGPRHWGDTLRLSASRLVSEPDYPARVFPFDQEGRGEELKATWMHPFIRSREENLTGRLSFIVSNEETEIREFPTLTSDDRTRVVEARGTYDFVDGLVGINLIDVALGQGLDILGASDDTEVSRQASDADATFTYLRGRLSRLQPLGDQWQLFGSLDWQYAFDPLLPAQRFSVGGRTSGRGFPPGSLTGDHGIAATAEIRWGTVVGDREWLDSYQVYGFFDYGHTWDRNAPPGVDDDGEVASLGAGVRLNLTEDIAFNPEIAHRLSGDGADDAVDDSDTRLLFSLTARF